MKPVLTFRREIAGLRAIAVLSVILYHYGFSLFSGGFVGVDVFFVISGFLMGALALKEYNNTGKFDVLAFYGRRLWRLFPALFATIFVSAIAAYVLLSPAAMQQFSNSAFYSAIGFANIYFWLQSGYFDTTAIQKPLLHMWSLGVEMQFYVIWPLVFIAVVGRSRKAVAAALAVLAILSLAANWFVAPGFPGQHYLTDPLADGHSIMFYLTPFRLFEFIIGAGLNWVPYAKWSKKTAELASLGGFLLIGYAVFAFDHTTTFPSTNALFPAFGAALLIAGGGTSRVGAVLRSNLAVGIGTISYSLYLVHWPLLVFYLYDTGQTTIGGVEQAILTVLAISLATALWYFVERPFHDKNNSISKSLRRIAVVALTGIMTIGAFSATASDGMVWRYPQLSFALSPSSAYGGEDCPYPSCTHGTTGREVLVVGDSFSRQLFAGLTTVFPDQRFRFWDQRMCATLSVQWGRWDDRNRAVSCKQTRQKLLDQLHDGSPLIMANHWGVGEYYDATEFAKTGKIVRKIIPAPDIYNFSASEAERLAAVSGSRGVLVVTNPPDVAAIGDLQKCVVAAIDDKSVICDHTPLSTDSARRALAFAFKNPSMRVIDPYNAFCSNGECENYDSGGFFYSDAYHLSRHGSIKFVEAAKGQFAAFLDSVNR